MAGGITTMLHADQITSFVDSIFVDKIEYRRLETVLKDF